MSIYEYDEEREMRLIRADEREIGMEMGLEAGVRGMISMAKEFNDRLNNFC